MAAHGVAAHHPAAVHPGGSVVADRCRDATSGSWDTPGTAPETGPGAKPGTAMSEGRTAPLIAAKQVVPPVRPGAVRRARLHAPLLANAWSRLSVVVAPAGWGKTTLLSQWAHDPAETRCVVWVSLDEADDDPVRFWTYVLSALQRDVAGLGPAALRALSTPGLEPVDLALPTLLNELATVDGAYVLVLDDYHLVGSAAVHEGVEFLLSYLPPALRVVIAGRSDPPLPLARLRARGELTELRAAELGFRVDEAAALLTAVGETPVEASAATVLTERTEGWAAGLQLAALTIRHAERPAEAAGRLDGGDRHILDYLSLEVVDRLAPDHRDLLVRASVLERLSGPLCDAALDRTGSGAALDALDRADLFVTALDPHREWYRCHRLFRDVLLRRLAADPDARTRVLARAADWFLERGYVAEAVAHRIAAGDEGGAADLLRSQVPAFLERGELAVHLQLGRQLPAATVLRDARLCVSLAWAAGLNGQYSQMGPWLDAADDLIDGDSPALEGWHTLRGAAATLRAVERSIAHADLEAALAAAAEACRLECDSSVAGYVVARTVLGAMLGFADRPEDAVRALDGVWEQARVIGLPPLLALQAAGALATVLAETGRTDRLRRLLAEVAPTVRAAEDRWGDSTAPGVARLRTIEGVLAHRDRDLARAGALLRRAVDLARTYGEPLGLVTALTALAEVELDGDDRPAARMTLAEARDVVDNEAVTPLAVRRLDAVELRAGRASVREARRGGALVEELTDREQAILRALSGNATQREIGSSLYLSINTVKGYTKILYRKLGVGSREDAVREGRALGLI
jgi:LuxR family transcriptional regulator, maltose regulon positive regulatory protein